MPAPRMPYDAEEHEARGANAANLLLRKTLPTNKREAKKLVKEKEIVRLHQIEHLRPAEIAKIMRVSANDVYRACHGYLSRVKKFQEFDDRDRGSSVMRKLPLDRIQVKEKVAQYLGENGLYKMKRATVQEYLHDKLSDSKVPTLNEIGSLLKNDFKIRYLRENPAAVKYRDPDIDERRKWASRLLCHMLCEEFLIISIDETHIRSDKNNHYAWQFAANERPFSRVLHHGFGQ